MIYFTCAMLDGFNFLQGRQRWRERIVDGWIWNDGIDDGIEDGVERGMEGGRVDQIDNITLRHDDFKDTRGRAGSRCR